ncbi:hypothetical protein [Chitiniphilus eburneus]|uniref:Uncharacterized protein n=1 Tax=Chitiniphilus eburneus TaxID=2571148 RepID=A0A4U0Q029_9NEIS|nr:hypothetical protein [Chitiniphilus eburneus]TJZ73302.1 hypothetical protein FAZ21_10590 [Chitiniphilus eburneus]
MKSSFNFCPFIFYGIAYFSSFSVMAMDVKLSDSKKVNARIHLRNIDPVDFCHFSIAFEMADMPRSFRRMMGTNKPSEAGPGKQRETPEEQ